jgi:hypothetical protein
VVPPCSDRISRVPPYSRILRAYRIRGCHPLRPAFPDRSATPRKTTGLFRVRSPLLAESLLMSFPPGTEMFQFPGFASTPYVFRCRYPRGWVAPFGCPRIKACSRLPVAFRSVPRPSSPPGAKASTECPSRARDHKGTSIRRCPGPPCTGTIHAHNRPSLSTHIHASDRSSHAARLHPSQGSTGQTRGRHRTGHEFPHNTRVQRRTRT